jgi:hypothetical protein
MLPFTADSGGVQLIIEVTSPPELLRIFWFLGEELWPWEHAAKDPSRVLGYEFIEWVP